MNPGKLNEHMNKELISEAFSKKLQIHISLKDGTWRNGFVKKIYADFFEFQDTENPIEVFFYIQLRKVEPFIKRGGE